MNESVKVCTNRRETHFKECLYGIETRSDQEISQQLKDKAVSLFNQISNIHYLIRPGESFPYYGFITAKILEKLESEHLNKYIPMLSHPDKVKMMNNYWTDASNYLGW